PGDRVAIMLRNCVSWIMFDQAAMGLDLVTVPLYTSDRPENVAYILQDSGAKALVLENADQWAMFAEVQGQLTSLKRVLCINASSVQLQDSRLAVLRDWLPKSAEAVKHVNSDGMKLTSIIYTSGTTGKPKGVMLSHNNMLENAAAALKCFEVTTEDLFLSFLPMSHTLERTAGCYLTMMAGACVAYARSIPQLGEDLVAIRPTIMISVPRIYERVYGNIRTRLAEGPVFRRKLFDYAVEVGWARFQFQQGRGSWKPSFFLWPLLNRLVAAKVMARLGGRLRAAVSGGAALSPDIAKLFVGLGLPILQGYGLTETSPVVSTNRLDDNVPASIGKPIPGVQVRLGDKDALLVKGPNVMLGYWNLPDATHAMFTPDGWLNTGDTARFDDEGHLYITGRLKEIIVMSNGEKVSPVDMEAAILQDNLFDQVMIMGEGKPYLTAFVVLNHEQWAKLTVQSGKSQNAQRIMADESTETIVLDRVQKQIRSFPGYAKIPRVAVLAEPWTIENGLLTPTMKLKRTRVLESYKKEFDRLYAGH
ncbi:MAG TPA: long-chain fatty acid--CoA ligase, partial [Chitinophagaceae bacterium]